MSHTELVNEITERIVKAMHPQLVDELHHVYIQEPKGIEGGYYEMHCPCCNAYITIWDGAIEKALKESGVIRG